MYNIFVLHIAFRNLLMLQLTWESALSWWRCRDCIPANVDDCVKLSPRGREPDGYIISRD